MGRVVSLKLVFRYMCLVSAQTHDAHKALLTRAFEAQRKGDIESYSFLTADAEAEHTKIDA